MSTNASLRSLLSDSALPQNEAKILLAFVIEKHYQLPRSALLSRDEMELSLEALEQWRNLESKRLSGEPIAYLVGKRGFHDIELYVAPGVLIPRSETEILVEIALREIQTLNRPANIVDLGTGSGAIALAIAHSAPQTIVTATDQSLEALAIAKMNAEQLGFSDRVQFAQGSWYTALEDEYLSTQFDVILSNPPYIAAGDSHLSEGDLRFEPASALTDGAGGLFCLEAIILQVHPYLKPGGLVAVEHGFDQSDAVVNLMKAAQLQEIQVYKDLAGHCRVVSGRKSKS